MHAHGGVFVLVALMVCSFESLDFTSACVAFADNHEAGRLCLCTIILSVNSLCRYLTRLHCSSSNAVRY